MDEPAHIRAVRKSHSRFSKVANARDTIEGFGHGMDVMALTYGQFSLIDLVDAALEITGPAHVVIATWSAGFYDVDAALKFRDSGRMLSCRFLMDSSEKRGQSGPGDVSGLFGRENVRVARSHAKFVLVGNDAWSVVITASMNLNLNPRCEHFEMTDDAERYGMLSRFIDGVWGELPAGSTGDRTMPGLVDLPAVRPKVGVALTERISVGVWAG